MPPASGSRGAGIGARMPPLPIPTCSITQPAYPCKDNVAPVTVGALARMSARLRPVLIALAVLPAPTCPADPTFRLCWMDDGGGRCVCTVCPVAVFYCCVPLLRLLLSCWMSRLDNHDWFSGSLQWWYSSKFSNGFMAVLRVCYVEVVYWSTVSIVGTVSLL